MENTKDSKNKVSAPVAVLFSLFSTACFASAYMAFANGTKGYPTGSSFFWFMLFSFVCVVIFPSKVSWRDTVLEHKKSFWLILADVLLYFFQFVCTLLALQQDQPGVALTVVALLLIRSPLATIFGYFICYDTAKNWWAYWIGTAILILGTGLYRIGMNASEFTTTFDLVFWLSLAMVIFAGIDVPVRKRYREKYKITPLNTLRTTFGGVTALAFVWMMIETLLNLETGYQWPDATQWGALAYLGLVPTAIGITLADSAVDSLGVPITQSITNLMPIFTIFIGMIPLAFFAMPNDHLDPIHYAGLGLTVFGVCIASFFTGTKKREGKTPE